MKPFNTPERLGTDQGGSVDKPIVYMQRLQVSGKINTTDFFIPCDLDTVEQCFLTPVANPSSTSDNLVALFTTVVGWEIDALDNSNLLALSDIDDWATSTVYEVGTVVDGNTDDSEAHVCVVAHTSGVWATDETSGYWETIPSTKFIQVSHTSPGTGDVVNVHVLLLGRMST